MHQCEYTIVLHEFWWLDIAAEGRLALLTINLKDVMYTEDCDLEKIAKLTEGYSGADITNVCRCVKSYAFLCQYVILYSLKNILLQGYD